MSYTGCNAHRVDFFMYIGALSFDPSRGVVWGEVLRW